MSSAAHGDQSAQQERGLADAGLTADEHERGSNEPAAEYAVELIDAGRDTLGFVDRDVDEAQERTRGRSLWCPHALLHQRAEGAAAGTAAEPASRDGTAFAARVLDRRCLRHDASAYAQVPTAIATTSSQCGPVRYRQLGDSDLHVSEISLGSWLTFGGGVGRADAVACVDAAFDVGINLVDTANVASFGRAG